MAKLHDIQRALLEIGFDATPAECSGYLNEEVTSEALELIRADLQSQDPGKSWYSKKDRLLQRAIELTLTTEGRQAIREAISRLGKQEILEILGKRAGSANLDS
ncbi:MAG: hypothetical protein QM811_12995 [Pirellulales bacterium]